MKLSSRARHAVRLALEIARRGGADKPVRLKEISRITGISRRFLEQLATSLKNHALIRGVVGRNGGYVLARPADEITVCNVINAVIGPLDLSICTLNENLCMSSGFCECRLVWLLLKKRVNEVLNEYTLADILNKNWTDSMRHRLGVATHVEDRQIGGM